MSDNLYNKLFESWQKMSEPQQPQLITEAEIRESFSSASDDQVANIKAICEGYLKFEELVLNNSEQVLLELAGDQTLPKGFKYDPAAGKAAVDAEKAQAAQAAQPQGDQTLPKGFKYDPAAGKAALDAEKAQAAKPDAKAPGKMAWFSKLKNFAGKVKEIYKQAPKKKILAVLAAGLVIAAIAPHFPVVGALAKVAFGGFNIFKGSKSFWSEFKKEKKDRSSVKVVLAVLQAALGVVSGISGASGIVDQITALKQQVVTAAGDTASAAAPAAPDVPADAPASAAPAAPEAPAPAAPAAPDVPTDAPAPAQAGMVAKNPTDLYGDAGMANSTALNPDVTSLTQEFMKANNLPENLRSQTIDHLRRLAASAQDGEMDLVKKNLMWLKDHLNLTDEQIQKVIGFGKKAMSLK